MASRIAMESSFKVLSRFRSRRTYRREKRSPLYGPLNGWPNGWKWALPRPGDERG